MFFICVLLKCLENETVYCRCTQEHTNWDTEITLRWIEMDHINFEAILISQYNQIDFFLSENQLSPGYILFS